MDAWKSAAPNAVSQNDAIVVFKFSSLIHTYLTNDRDLLSIHAKIEATVLALPRLYQVVIRKVLVETKMKRAGFLPNTKPVTPRQSKTLYNNKGDGDGKKGGVLVFAHRLEYPSTDPLSSSEGEAGSDNSKMCMYGRETMAKWPKREQDGVDEHEIGMI